MRSLFAQFGALVGGVLASAAVIAVITGFERLTDFNLFSLMIWFVVPVGAFATGLLVAGGSYVAAVKLHARPSRMLAVSMLIVTAFTQFGLYYAQYAIATVEDGRAVRDLVGFGSYVQVLLANMRYGFHVHGARIGDGIEIGVLGYVVAAVQFVALLVGGLGVYFVLVGRAYCEPCARYARSVGTRLETVRDADFQRGLTELRALAPLSASYHEKLAPADDACAAAIEVEEWACDGCGRCAVSERPKTRDEHGWKYVAGGERTVWVEPERGASAGFSLRMP